MRVFSELLWSMQTKSVISQKQLVTGGSIDLNDCLSSQEYYHGIHPLAPRLLEVPMWPTLIKLAPQDRVYQVWRTWRMSHINTNTPLLACPIGFLRIRKAFTRSAGRQMILDSLKAREDGASPSPGVSRNVMQANVVSMFYWEFGSPFLYKYSVFENRLWVWDKYNICSAEVWIIHLVSFCM